MLIRATKIKSKKADYTINYCTNERGKSNSGCHRPTLKCFYSFFFLSRMKGEIPLPRSLLVSIYLSESCKKSNGVSAEKIQIFAMFNLPRRQNKIFHSFEICLYVCINFSSIKNRCRPFIL